MPISITIITKEQADFLRLIDENQFGDLKAKEVAPKDLSKHISAFANADYYYMIIFSSSVLTSIHIRTNSISTHNR